MDFSGDSCKTVLKYLYDTYGETHVASIGKFGSNYTKGTVRDMCRVLGIELSQADSIAKSFGDYQIEEIDSMIAGDIPTPDNAKEAVRYVKQYSELFRYVRKLNGLPKSFGLHACGKIISVGELDDYLPSRYDANGIRFLEGDMHDVEDVGLVKVDVLGLRTLDQEFDTLEMSGEDRSFIRSKQSFNDKKVLDVFRNGDTVGIFQFSSPGMKKTLQKMDVRGIDDISIANALFRPGAMAYIDNFCKRRKGQEQFEYLHPDLEPILKNTYGIIVFQEQLIEIGRMAKIHNPDLLRKATGKKNPKLLNQVRPELEEKLKQRGWTDAQFEKLWTDMIEFSRYSFNKSHSSAYGILAYMTAKQKAYYPAEFFAGLCNSFLGDSAFVKDHAKEIMSDVYRHKVRVWPLDYQQDHRRCSVKDGGILFGIPLIKGMNAAVADTLWAMKDRKYSHFWQIVMEMQANGVTTAQIPNLIRLGFFSSWGSAKALLRVFDFCQQFAKGGEFSKTISKKKIENDQVLYSILEKHSESTNAKGVPLASFRKIDMPSVLSDVEEYCINNVRGDFSLKEKVATQVDLLGFVMGSGVQSDRPKLLVHEMYPVNRKSDNKQFAWSIVAQSIGSGKLERYTIRMALFKTNPIQVGQIIHCLKYEMYKQYYTITSYRILC